MNNRPLHTVNHLISLSIAITRDPELLGHDES